MAETYLITGGAGFIGSHIAEMLVADGQRVRIYDNLASGHEHNLAAFRGDVEFIEADIRDTAALAQAMRGVDYVFHEAAMVSVFESVEKPALCHEINLTGTLGVCQAAKDAGVKRLVMAGTAATYGNNPTLPKREDMMPEPESPYGLTKVAGEYYLQTFAKLYGLETAILRYFNVYGPRQDPSSMYSGVISKFTDLVRAGQTPTIFGDGLQTRDFVFVKDIARANILAMRSSKVGHGEVCNIGTGRRVSLLDLLAAMSKIVDRDLSPQFKDARAGDVQHSVADISRARELLDYAPQYDLESGLRQLFASLD